MLKVPITTEADFLRITENYLVLIIQASLEPDCEHAIHVPSVTLSFERGKLVANASVKIMRELAGKPREGNGTVKVSFTQAGDSKISIKFDQDEYWICDSEGVHLCVLRPRFSQKGKVELVKPES